MAALLLFAAWIYAPVRTFAFVTWDDEAYVSRNPDVAAGLTIASIRWALTAMAPYWHPFTWLSHLLDVQLFGLDAGAHHVVSLVWHLANTLLLFAVLQRMTARPWCSVAVAAIFAVHPLHVESVAWIAERKDVLSAFFAFLTIGAYVRYARAPSSARMALVFLCFCASLLAKPMFVTMPMWLLILDWWPLARPRSIARVTEKLVLLIPSIAVSAIAFIGQQRVGTVAGLVQLPIGARVSNAAIAYGAYLRKTIWPVDLAALYPYPDAPPSASLVATSAGAVVAISLVVWFWRRLRYPAAGWLWFLVLLVPVIGLVQVGNQAYADRFTYVPIVGLAIALVWGLADVAHRTPMLRAITSAAFVVIVVVLGVVARAQVMTWATSETMWTQVVAVTPESYYGHTSLGAELLDRGDVAGARRHQEGALALRPNDPEVNNEMGMVLVREGDIASAIARFDAAIRANPGFDEARSNLARAHFTRGDTLARQGNMAAALPDFEAAVAGDARRVEFQVALGIALVNAGRRSEALAHLRAALAVDPANDRLRQLIAQIER